MKILIVEDNEQKLDTLKNLLDDLGLSEYSDEKFVSLAMKRIKEESFDLVITDMGLPRFADRPASINAREGLNMMFDLAYNQVFVPTIVFSTTDIHKDLLGYLTYLKYPFIGRCENIDEVRELLNRFLQTGCTEELCKDARKRELKRNAI